MFACNSACFLVMKRNGAQITHPAALSQRLKLKRVEVHLAHWDPPHLRNVEVELLGLHAVAFTKHNAIIAVFSLTNLVLQVQRASFADGSRVSTTCFKAASARSRTCCFLLSRCPPYSNCRFTITRRLRLMLRIPGSGQFFVSAPHDSRFFIQLTASLANRRQSIAWLQFAERQRHSDPFLDLLASIIRVGGVDKRNSITYSPSHIFYLRAQVCAQEKWIRLWGWGAPNSMLG